MPLVRVQQTQELVSLQQDINNKRIGKPWARRIALPIVVGRSNKEEYV